MDWEGNSRSFEYLEQISCTYRKHKWNIRDGTWYTGYSPGPCIPSRKDERTPWSLKWPLDKESIPVISNPSSNSYVSHFCYKFSYLEYIVPFTFWAYLLYNHQTLLDSASMQFLVSLNIMSKLSGSFWSILFLLQLSDDAFLPLTVPQQPA